MGMGKLAPGQPLPADKTNQLKPPQLCFIYGLIFRWPLNGEPLHHSREGTAAPTRHILGRCNWSVSHRQLSSCGDHGKGGERKRLHRGAKHDGEPFFFGETCRDTPTLHLSPATCNITAALL